MKGERAMTDWPTWCRWLYGAFLIALLPGFVCALRWFMDSDIRGSYREHPRQKEQQNQKGSGHNPCSAHEKDPANVEDELR